MLDFDGIADALRQDDNEICINLHDKTEIKTKNLDLTQHSLLSQPRILIKYSPRLSPNIETFCAENIETIINSKYKTKVITYETSNPLTSLLIDIDSNIDFDTDTNLDTRFIP